MRPSSGRCDRRAFLRSLGAAGVMAYTLPVVGCRAEDPGARADGPGGPEPEQRGGAILVDRPVLLPWGPDAVRIASPLDELPLAYVSTARREVFVDRESRGLSKWLLDAHISVSTGVWRIPLPGDPPSVPITPGDTIREFEELDIVAWDSAMEPAEGDFRIRRGAPRAVRYDFTCVPSSVDGAWHSGGPWDVARCARSAADETCREDFLELGTGLRHPLRGCAEEGQAVRFLAWSAREGG